MIAPRISEIHETGRIYKLFLKMIYQYFILVRQRKRYLKDWVITDLLQMKELLLFILL